VSGRILPNAGASRCLALGTQGYRSGRDMYCIVLHEQHGEIERHRVDVGALVNLT